MFVKCYIYVLCDVMTTPPSNPIHPTNENQGACAKSVYDPNTFSAVRVEHLYRHISSFSQLTSSSHHLCLTHTASIHECERWIFRTGKKAVVFIVWDMDAEKKLNVVSNSISDVYIYIYIYIYIL